MAAAAPARDENVAKTAAALRVLIFVTALLTAAYFAGLALWSTPPTGFVRFATQSTDLGEGARCGSNRGARAGRPAPRMLQ